MSRFFVILFAGGVNAMYNHKRYQADLQRMAAAIISIKGFSLETTHFLHSHGEDSFNINGLDFPSKAATRENLKSTLVEVAAIAKIDDRFLFVASNHGGKLGPDKVTLWCWNEEFVDNVEFTTWCDGLEPSLQAYIFGQCYSGGFTSGLPSETRLVMSASSRDELSWASADGESDEFLQRVNESISAGATTLNQVFQEAKERDTRNEHPEVADPGSLGDRVEFFAR